MLWLDSTYPTNGTAATGANRGSCSTSSGVPATVEQQNANSKVVFSNIKFGPIGSTGNSTTGTGTPTGGGGGPTSTGSSTGATQTHYGQCGGTGYSGPTQCASGTTCQVLNQFYSQCL